MNKPVAVPRLNLAPKRRKPLSLRNPLDYLQLLYWVFFFPQALRWYVETFAEEKELYDCKTWIEKGQWWRNAHIQRNFWLQGLFLTALVPVLITWVVSCLGVPVSSFGVAFGIAFGVAFGVAFSSVGNVALAVTYSIEFSIAGGVAGGVLAGSDARSTLSFFILFVEKGIAFSNIEGVAYGIACGVMFGVVFGVTLGVTDDLRSGISYYVPSDQYGSAYSFAFGIASGFAYGITGGLANGIAYGTACFLVLIGTYCLVVLRLETWAVTALYRGLSKYRLKFLSRTTFVPLPRLTKQILSWANHDWIRAVQNINELLAYTRQHKPVIDAITQYLSKLPGDVLLLRVSQLAVEPFDWDTIRYASMPVQRLKDSTESLDTPAQSAALGFWYLHEEQPREAAAAFALVRNLPHGAEMHQLATCLVLASTTEQLNDSRLVSGLTIPTTPLMRSDTWPAISRFRSVVDDAQIIFQSYSRSVRFSALNRALGKLTEITQRIDRVPQAERKLVATIAESWKKKLLDVIPDTWEIIHTQPVHNPYVAGDPVEGSLFVGRTDIIKQLEELWLMSNQLQSVVLYGHRRMGKTSILKNLSSYLRQQHQRRLHQPTQLRHRLSQTKAKAKCLIAISDVISQTLSISPTLRQRLSYGSPPSLSNASSVPLANGYNQDQGLIIALDEFEKIEELISTGALSKDFLGFLRGLLQEHANIAFAFAGLHTLEEMTEDYFNPLFASILPIRIGFFTLGETRQLLANPAEDFTLDYQPEALNEIYRLTAGQPYLTQLIGFQLVRHYNHQVFEEGRERSPIFTPEDLTIVIHQSDFFAKGRYYFTGVWNQAAQDASGQQAILKVLSQERRGIQHVRDPPTKQTF